MTTEQYKDHVYGFMCTCGTVRYTLEYRGNTYKCTCHNTMAYDRLQCEDISPKSSHLFYTLKQALSYFYEAGLKQHGFRY